MKDASNFDCKKKIGNGLIIIIKDASNLSCKKNLKHPIGDGQIITTVATTTIGIFFALMAVKVEQPKALLLSTAVTCLLSLPM